MTSKNTRGFTLVELLITIVILAILSALILVSYNGITGRAHDSTVQADIRQFEGKLKNTAALDELSEGLSNGSAYSEEAEDFNNLLPAPSIKSYGKDRFSLIAVPVVDYFNNTASFQFAALSKSGKVFMTTDTGSTIKRASIDNIGELRAQAQEELDQIQHAIAHAQDYFGVPFDQLDQETRDEILQYKASIEKNLVQYSKAQNNDTDIWSLPLEDEDGWLRYGGKNLVLPMSRISGTGCPTTFLVYDTKESSWRSATVGWPC